MNKKNLFSGLFLVLIALLYSCSGIEANVDITLPKGPKGDSGLSAYEVWKESVNNGTIIWPKNEVEINDFFRFLKGKDGENGKNGKDGKSAYEQWKEFIASGNVDDPHNPGKKWDPNKNTMKDFWSYLAGKDGKNGVNGLNGMSAYELWKEDLRANCGKENQIMNPHDPSKPWPCEKNSIRDFWQYLRGVDGQSAYALWKEKVLDGTIEWPKTEVSETDFFRYLKGKDGKDGKDGEDGSNGLSAFQLWVQYISTGDVDDPHNPGKKWDPAKNSINDFWAFLTGAKGEQGKSAHKLWQEELAAKCGTPEALVDQNTGKPWECTENSLADFLRYLRGMNGASAYDIWKQGVLDGSINWPKGEISVTDFFRYLKGDKGDKGDDGKPGKPGTSAYEIWKEYISTGNVDDPHNPGKKWDPKDNSEQAFWRFLAGAKGEKGDKGDPGQSAYELWRERVTTNCGKPGLEVMNPHNPGNAWPCDKVSQKDFFEYLRGVDGKSAYALWKEKVLDGTILWPKNEVSETDFFRYLKGKDGENGSAGLSAYQFWVQFISSGNVPDPHNPGKLWDAHRNSIQDFWIFLTGAKGEQGKSAYELWKEELKAKYNTPDALIDRNTGKKWPLGDDSMADFLRYLRGMDGLSAHEIWKKAVLDGTISWPKGEVSVTDFFRYLKGEKGDKGDKGDKGNDGTSAYEVWKALIKKGVPNPHKPGENWDPNKDGESDFFAYLTGPKGEKGVQGEKGQNGKSAYELWKEDLAARCDSSNPVMNPHKPTEKWPCEENTLADFLRYLRGMDGLSAYEIWLKGVQDKTIPWTGSTGTDGFFLYLKGEKGEKGADGTNGKDGASAYEIWKAAIKKGLPNPHKPGENWDPNLDAEQNFWQFLAGPKGDKGDPGEPGKSAYELWKEQVETNCGNPATQVMNPHDPTKVWPCTKVTQDDFWDYLRGPRGSDGKDGKDGEPGQAVEVGRPNVLPVFYNGKLREYVDPSDGSVVFQVFDKEGNKASVDVEVKGIPGVTNQDHVFKTDSDGKIRVPRDMLPEKQPLGLRVGKAMVKIDGAFEESAPNTITPNKIHTRIVMEFAYLRQYANSSWTRSQPNNLTVIHYKYEREVDGTWEEYPVGLPSATVKTVKVNNPAKPTSAADVVEDPEWGKEALETYGAPFLEKVRGRHLFFRPVVLTPSEEKAFNAGDDLSRHKSGWLTNQANMNRKYKWDKKDRYMSVQGNVNFYGEAPIMEAAVHVPEIYPIPMVCKADLKMNIVTGTTSLWGKLNLIPAAEKLEKFYLRYEDNPQNGVWRAIQKLGADIPTLFPNMTFGIGMTKSWNGTSGSTASGISPFKKGTVSKHKFVLNDTYPGNFVGFYALVADPKGVNSLPAEDERVLHNDFVPYRDGGFFKLELTGDLQNATDIKLIDVFDKDKVYPIEKKEMPSDWMKTAP